MSPTPRIPGMNPLSIPEGIQVNTTPATAGQGSERIGSHGDRTTSPRGRSTARSAGTSPHSAVSVYQPLEPCPTCGHIRRRASSGLPPTSRSLGSSPITPLNAPAATDAGRRDSPLRASQLAESTQRPHSSFSDPGSAASLPGTIHSRMDDSTPAMKTCSIPPASTENEPAKSKASRFGAALRGMFAKPVVDESSIERIEDRHWAE